MSRKRRIVILFLVTLSGLSACGGGGGGSTTTIPPVTIPPVTNVSPGGYWGGVDSNGQPIDAFVTETGELHITQVFGGDRYFGSGVVTVTNGNDLAGDFQLIAPMADFFGGLDDVFADGTTSADCTLSGTVTQRNTMTVTVICTTTAGLEDQITATLGYRNSHDRDSSMATIGGNYQWAWSPALPVILNITGAGTMFSQDAGTGCIITGQVNIINSTFDIYDIEIGFSNCLGQDAILNNSVFVGIGGFFGALSSPDRLFVFVIGDVAGVLTVIWTAYDRL